MRPRSWTAVASACSKSCMRLLIAPPPRPFCLLHPIRYWQVLRREQAMRDWMDAWREELESLRAALAARQIAAYAQQVTTMFSGVVQDERAAIRALVERLRAAAAAIGCKHRAAVPESLSVDRAILPGSSYETIYADCIRGGLGRHAGRPDQAGRARTVPGRFPPDHAGTSGLGDGEAGRAFFDRVLTIDLDAVLTDPRYARHVPEPSQLLAGLWERAEPLVNTSGAILPPDWGIAELAALWLPGPESAHLYSPLLTSLGYHPHVTVGTATSVHLCRVIHGFTAPSMKLLKVYITSYDAEPNKRELHILDWIDRLPPLPEAE